MYWTAFGPMPDEPTEEEEAYIDSLADIDDDGTDWDFEKYFTPPTAEELLSRIKKEWSELEAEFPDCKVVLTRNGFDVICPDGSIIPF